MRAPNGETRRFRCEAPYVIGPPQDGGAGSIASTWPSGPTASARTIAGVIEC